MTSSPDRPLLVFPMPEVSTRPRRTGGLPKQPHLPSPERQRERLAPQFARLEQSLQSSGARLRADATGTFPEQVLVLETVGTIDDFLAAVRRISGMEWLAEWDEDAITPDEDFFQDEAHPERPIGGRLFLVLANQRAIDTLLGLWGRFRDDPAATFPWGMAKWRQLFQHLREIRTWGVQDRLHETGVLDYWRERVEAGTESVRFETELWFRRDPQARREARTRVERRVQEQGGRVVGESVIAEIEYHSLLTELSIGAVEALLRDPDTQLVQLEDIMFLRPVGQFAVRAPDDQPSLLPDEPGTLPQENMTPILAVFDGLPLENHRFLAGRLIIDDPDGWAADYPARDRQHGTAMASLVVHGELDATEPPLQRLVYVRPILRPEPRDWRTPRDEAMPDDVLAVDLVHRAVRRLYEGDADEPAVAPTIRIINFSVGDRARPFDRRVSPIARLLDWLSWKYNVLFVVSAGNHADDIVLDIADAAVRGLNDPELECEVLKAIAKEARHRRLLAPAESVNAVTVGAAHSDASTAGYTGHSRDLLCSPGLPSPVSAIGSGFRRSIKPDLLLPGGRQFYHERLQTSSRRTIFSTSTFSQPPGQRAASPGPTPGDIRFSRYWRGTSNAAALASRAAARLHEVVQQLRAEVGDELLEERYVPVLLKALLIHGTLWGGGRSTIEAMLRVTASNGRLREHIARFVGYGVADMQRVSVCTDQRATMLGCGTIGDGIAHTFAVPLPPSLSGQKVWRRLTLTLAWLTPINPSHQGYRRAALRMDPPLAELQVDRTEADGNAVLRGTVQHEVLEGRRASAFTEGASLAVRVACRADAGDLLDPVPYALAATLEVAEDVPIPIYEEIRARIRPQVRLAPRAI